MKVTSFYPIIATSDLTQGLKEYTEDYGFKVKRRLSYPGLHMCVLENAHNDRIDLLEIEGVETGYYSMHINVEDFEESLAYFKEKGYEIEGKIIKYGQGIPYVNLVNNSNRVTISVSRGSL